MSSESACRGVAPPAPQPRRALRLVAVGLLGASAVLAARASGHFDVDDADVADPGSCTAEAWSGRARAQRTSFEHAGVMCRLGPVEWGFNADHASDPQSRGWVLGPQAKWQYVGGQPDATVAGAVLLVLATSRPRGEGGTGGQLLLPLSWQVAEPLRLHANLGVDWHVADAGRTPRRGLAGEWTLHPRVTLIAERNRAFEAWTTRLGVRIGIAKDWSVDLSGARVSYGAAAAGIDAGPAPRTRVFTIGLNRDWSR